jgi:Formamidopyrimidine-DNA glycosylase N-terminal domain
MPELPEVEHSRRVWDVGLGQKILKVLVPHPKVRDFRGTEVQALPNLLAGQVFSSSQANGKQIMFRFGKGSLWLGIHLGMSGRLTVDSASVEPGKHDHLILRQAKRSLVFSDQRQFGRVLFHQGIEAPDWPGSAHSLGSVHGESGEQLFAAPERNPVESGAANAGTVSWRGELDGRRNPLACPLKPGDQSGRARTGGGSESVANCPPGDPPRHRLYSGGLGLPGHLAISTSVGRWRQMSEVSLYAIPCEDRWPNNLLVSEVPE